MADGGRHTKDNPQRTTGGGAFPAEYPPCPVVAVGAVVFRNGRVLLVRRGKAPALGEWAIPGGSVRLGETLQEATEREILEETGIVIRAGKPMFTFDVIDRDEGGRIRFHYVIADLVAEYIRGAIGSGDDAAEARWVAPDDLRRMPINQRTRQLLGREFHFGI